MKTGMRSSLRFRLMFFVVAIVVIEAVIIAAAVLFLMARNEMSNTREQVKVITAISSDNLAPLIRAGNRNAVLERLLALKDGNIVFAQVYIGGRLNESVQNDTADVERAKELIQTDTNRLIDNQSEDLLAFSSPIFYGGEKIGVFVLGYSLKGYLTHIRDNSFIITVITLVILFLALLFSFVFVNSIVKAIKTVDQYAQKISKGDLSIHGIRRKRKDEIGSLLDSFERMNENLKSIIAKIKENTVELNSATREIEAATQEQTTGANEHASGITEVSVTLEELTATAKQITMNTGELVVASEEATRLLKAGETELRETLARLEDVSTISQTNAAKIVELGNRSELIGEMVEIIKDVSNKTNMLSINASIEASRAGEVGAGFNVVAAEIRELSKETLASAKNVGEAGSQIKNYLNDIVVSSESESRKVIESVDAMKKVAKSLEEIIEKIRKNNEFTQKIDVSIKQQESGSNQASVTMKQMAEIARQSAETARQTLRAVQDIVNFTNDLNNSVKEFNMGKATAQTGDPDS